MAKLITILNNEPRAGTVLIAEGFDRRHEQVVRLIKKYLAEFEKLNTLEVLSRKNNTRVFNEYMLTESQFFFLGTLFKNSEISIPFKLKLIIEFDKCKKQLNALSGKKNDEQWNEARLTGKTLRSIETHAIKEFIAYAKNQGGSEKGCNMYYANITKMMTGLLFICGNKFKDIRSVITSQQLITVGSAEQVITKSLRDDMKANVFYKDIYRNVKAKVTIFAELHGQSEVVLIEDDQELLN